MRENANKVVLEGYLYDLSGLEIKQVKKKDSIILRHGER